MPITVRNLTNQQLFLEQLIVPALGQVTAPFANETIINAVNAGQVAVTPAIRTLSTLTSTTGTPVASASGVRALAAITDVPTAANAIATLAAELSITNLELREISSQVMDLQTRAERSKLGASVN